MNLDQLSNLIQAISGLVQALAWPVLVLLVLLYIRQPLKKFLADASEFTFKAGVSGLEATARRQQIEAAASLGAAAAKSTQQGPDSAPMTGNAVAEVADVVSRAVQPGALRQLSTARVLWVDDNPANNTYEQRALEALGIRIVRSLDTADALERLQREQYDVIISDMARGDEQRAGYQLLAEKQKLGDQTPLIFYTSRPTRAQQEEAIRQGAYGQTDHPQQLFELVLSAIQNPKTQQARG